MYLLLVPKPTGFRKYLIIYRDMSVTYCTTTWLLPWMSLLLIPKPTGFINCLTTFFTGICLWHTVQGYGFSPGCGLKLLHSFVKIKMASVLATSSYIIRISVQSMIVTRIYSITISVQSMIGSSSDRASLSSDMFPQHF